jgi:hypothetical protein
VITSETKTQRYMHSGVDRLGIACEANHVILKSLNRYRMIAPPFSVSCTRTSVDSYIDKFLVYHLLAKIVWLG